MEYTLKLSQQMLVAMGEVLTTGPYKIVAPILNEIQKQVSEQDQKREEAQSPAKQNGGLASVAPN